MSRRRAIFSIARATRADALREWSIVRKFERCPNIVEILDVVQNRLVMELAFYGDASSFVRANPASKTRARLWTGQLCSALAFLHAMDVVHFDVKPENLLVYLPDLVKLTDFELARVANTDEPVPEGCGTELFMAPELFDGSSTVLTAAVDVWAAGVTFHFLLTKRFPFADANNTSKYKAHVKRDELRLDKRLCDLDQFMLGTMLNARASQRWSAKRLAADSFFLVEKESKKRQKKNKDCDDGLLGAASLCVG